MVSAMVAYGGGEGQGRGEERGSAEVMTLRESSKSLQSRLVLSGTLHVFPYVNCTVFTVACTGEPLNKGHAWDPAFCPV